MPKKSNYEKAQLMMKKSNFQGAERLFFESFQRTKNTETKTQLLELFKTNHIIELLPNETNLKKKIAMLEAIGDYSFNQEAYDKAIEYYKKMLTEVQRLPEENIKLKKRVLKSIKEAIYGKNDCTEDEIAEAIDICDQIIYIQTNDQSPLEKVVDSLLDKAFFVFKKENDEEKKAVLNELNERSIYFIPKQWALYAELKAQLYPHDEINELIFDLNVEKVDANFIQKPRKASASIIGYKNPYEDFSADELMEMLRNKCRK